MPKWFDLEGSSQFDLIDLTTAEPVWSDRFEYKRAAVGHVLD